MGLLLARLDEGVAIDCSVEPWLDDRPGKDRLDGRFLLKNPLPPPDALMGIPSGPT